MISISDQIFSSRILFAHKYKKGKSSKKRKKVKKDQKKTSPLIFIISVLIILAIGPYIRLKPTEIESPDDSSPSGLKITIHSPLNKTYKACDFSLNVSVSEEALWISDCFDDRGIDVECTKCFYYIYHKLHFNQGTHKITVYAADLENRTTNSSVIFTIET